MKKLVSTAVVMAALLTGGPANAIDPIGEIQSATSSASFDHQSVVGPRVAMYRRSDGSWVGRLRDRVIDVVPVKNGVRGAGVALYYERVKDGVVVRGHLGYSTVFLKIPADSEQLTILRWELKGEANAPEPPIPQFIFAAIAAL